MNIYLKEYISNNILPLYNKVDKAHDINHIKDVINSSIEISKYIKYEDINLNIVYASAAYHDIGLLSGDRTNHHFYSSQYVLNDIKLKDFFTNDEIGIISNSCMEHRSSYRGEYSSIYSKIVSDADVISSLNINSMIERSYIYNKYLYNDNNPMNHFDSVYNHLYNKYGSNGYMSFKLIETENAFKSLLDNSRKYIDNMDLFKDKYMEIVYEI